jgi:hypothetical protein
MCDNECFQIEVAKGYGNNEFKEDFGFSHFGSERPLTSGLRLAPYISSERHDGTATNAPV